MNQVDSALGAPASTPPTSDAPCRLCRCPMVKVPNIETQRILPLDKRAPVYLVCLYRGQRVAWDVNDFLKTCGVLAVKHADGHLEELKDVEGVHVTHFATCPQAAAFSGSRKKNATDGRR